MSMPNAFKYLHVDNKWALAAAIAVVFAQLFVEVLKRVAPGDVLNVVSRAMRMFFVVLLVAVALAYLTDPLALFLQTPRGETRIEGSVVDSNGLPVQLSDATVTLDGEVPGCGGKGDAARLGPNNIFSISCSKDPQVTFSVTISKPGFAPTPAWVTAHKENRFVLQKGGVQ
jgi:hypothetical protein